MRNAVFLMCLTCAQSLTAQDVCPGGRPVRGDYGIGTMEASVFFTGSATAGQSGLRFGTEPVILSVLNGSAAQGRLQPGDIIVSADRWLVTTPEGSRLLTEPPLDREVRLVVRRGSGDVTVSLRPRPSCRLRFGPAFVRLGTEVSVEAYQDELYILSDSDPWMRSGRASGTRQGDAAASTAGGRAGPAGWIGLRFDCNRCSMERDGDFERWAFREPPSVSDVARAGPAERAGLRAGDIVLSVDDHPIVSSAAHDRLAAVRAGQQLRIRVSREGTERQITVVALARPAGTRS